MLKLPVIAALLCCSALTTAQPIDDSIYSTHRPHIPAWYDLARYQVHGRLWISADNDDWYKKPIFLDAAKELARMGVKAHTRHTKSGDEGVIWKSSVGKSHPAVAKHGNIAQQIIDASHDAGLHIIAYQRHMEDLAYQQTHPDEVARDINGKPEERRGAMISFAGGYGDYLITHLKELTAMGADGFYLDEMHVPLKGDFSEVSVREYKKRYGKNLFKASAEEVEAWRQTIMAEFFGKLHRELTAINKDIILLLSANGTEYRLLKDFFPKYEATFFNSDQFERMHSLPLAATLFRDLSAGRPPHIWLSPKDTDQDINFVARLLAHGSIYNRDIRQEHLRSTPDTSFPHYAEQIALGNKVSPFLANTVPQSEVLVYIDETDLGKRAPIPHPVRDSFNQLKSQGVAVGMTSASMLELGIPYGTKSIVLPEKDLPVSKRTKAILERFKKAGGKVLYTRGELEPLARLFNADFQPGFQISSEQSNLDINVYRRNKQTYHLALTNGAEQNIELFIAQTMQPKKVTDAFSGQNIPLVKTKGGYKVNIDSLTIFAGLIIETE
ncbi:hypothetical protein ACVBEJ_02635 [Porticoccus sp. GXU_MW_L64]